MLASVTLNIHPLIVYGAGAVTLFLLAFFSTRILTAFFNTWRIKRKARILTAMLRKEQQIAARRLCREQKEAAEKKKKREDSIALFPEPWLSIHDECRKISGADCYVDRGILFNAWLLQKLWLSHCSELPKLSWKAVHKFATMVACSTSDTDKDFVRAAETLSAYLQIGTTTSDKKTVIYPRLNLKTKEKSNGSF